MRTLVAIFSSVCAILSGCKSYTPVTVIVSDSAGSPVRGASVQVAPMYFFNPTDTNYIFIGPYDILDPFPAKGSAGTTGDNGRVLLEVVADSPLELNVFAEKYQPWQGQIALTKQGEIEISEYPNESLLEVEAVTD